MLMESLLFEKLTDFLSGKRQPQLAGNVLKLEEGTYCAFGCSSTCYGSCKYSCENSCMDTCIANCESGKGNSSSGW